MIDCNSRYKIIFVHGFLGSAEDWQPIVKNIRRRELHGIFTPTLPGHGLCPAESSGQGLAGMANWLARYINRLTTADAGVSVIDNRQHLLVGYSLGGRILLTLAAQILAGNSQLAEPSKIAGMIIESANPGLPEQEKTQRWQQDLQWSRQFAQWPVTKTLAAWYQQDVFTDLDEAVRARLIAERSANNPKALAKVLLSCSLAKQADYRTLLLNPPFPLNYWYGTRDKKFRDIAEQLHHLKSTLTQPALTQPALTQPALTQPGVAASAQHGLVITEFPRAGHNCHLADPGEYVRQLLAVLSEPSF